MTDKNLMEAKHGFGENWIDTLLIFDKSQVWVKHVNALNPIVDLEIRLNGEVVHEDTLHELVDTLVQVTMHREKKRIGFDDQANKLEEIRQELVADMVEEVNYIKSTMLSKFSSYMDSIKNEFEAQLDDIQVPK